VTAVAAVVTAAAALLAGSAFAEDSAARAAKLRALAETYCEDRDIEKARRSLEAIAATPSDLLAVLRQPARPAEAMVGGSRRVEMTDEHGKATELFIYAPPTEVLRARTKPVGLVVMLHGLGGNAGNAEKFAEKLLAQGDIVCVAPSATKLPAASMKQDDGIPELVRTRLKHWWSYDHPKNLILESLRRGRELFWVDPERVTLGGVSMGGYGTWNVGLRHPDHWAALAPIAGGLSRFSAISDKDAYSISLLENGRNLPIFSAHPKNDPLVPCDSDRDACAYLERIGGTVRFEAVDLGHTPEDLKKAMSMPLVDDMMRFMMTARRNTSPRAVKFVCVSEPLDGSHWLRVVERTGVARPVLEGEVDETHRKLTVRTQGCRRSRVYLDERVLDGDHEVEVVANGQRVFRGKIVASLEAVLESWRTRRDAGLVYAACVDVGAAFR
ncbi:MAG: hypothetical protein ACAI25_03710, partial [Planctomycetota bacterium]